MGILETRIHETNSSKFIRGYFKGLSVFCCYNEHRKGRIWMVWNPKTVTVSPVLSHSQIIHCHVLHHSSYSSFHCSFVYASNDPNTRIELWDSLSLISASVQEWLVLGDFNVIRDISERISSTLPNLDDILAFNTCLLNCGLMDLQCSGCEFTWTNKQDGVDRVWSKLDRDMVNGSWMRKFSVTSAQFLPAGVSDHSPALVTVLHKFLARLRNVRLGLQSFHKTNTLGLQRRVAQARVALDSCSMELQRHPTCSVLLQAHQDSLHYYLKLKHTEISMLTQKAKADKIINNDSNSHMFHARIRERHHSQVVGEIIDHNGIQRTGSAQVVEGFLLFYQQLLGTSTAVQDLDSFISDSHRVEPSDWCSLTRDVQ
ncbi:hypothetical protein RND81_05G149100 [Saponaria officinalis]|uniref:Uncharacterized protein n=1 Tax=Saponaria officinalis TaxID=3572 RepID=A0AAW1KY81_SAPOF